MLDAAILQRAEETSGFCRLSDIHAFSALHQMWSEAASKVCDKDEPITWMPSTATLSRNKEKHERKAHAPARELAEGLQHECEAAAGDGVVHGVLAVAHGAGAAQKRNARCDILLKSRQKQVRALMASSAAAAGHSAQQHT